MSSYYSCPSIRLNKSVRVVLASSSKLFLQGIHKILESDAGIVILASASSYEELKTCLIQLKPEFLFIDNTTLEINVHNILNLISKSTGTKIILFRNQIENEVRLPDVLFVTEKTSTFDLIQILKGVGPNNNSRIKKIRDEKNHDLTVTEAKVLSLVGAGLSNKEVAKRLLITEKTAKCHLNNIFRKLGLHNRYQLIVYASRRQLQRNDTGRL